MHGRVMHVMTRWMTNSRPFQATFDANRRRVMSLAVLALYVHSTRLGVVVPGARVVDHTVPNIDLILRPFAHLHDRRTSYEVLVCPYRNERTPQYWG
jgi:hypothetical protein